MRRSIALGSLLLALSLSPAVLWSAEDSAAIESLFADTFAELWQRGDARGLSELWTEQGDWMSLVGSRRIRSGRQEIAEVWEIGLQGRDTPEKRALRLDVQAVNRLSPALAQVDVEMIFGTEATGLIREAMVAIVELTGEGWRIASARVARIPER